MELQLVTYEQAKKLKDLGFPQRIYNYLYLDGELTSKEEYDEMDCGGPFSVELSESECLSAPSLDLVVKWLREEKNIWVNVWADSEDNEHNKFNTVFYEQVCYGKDNKIISNKGIFVHLTYEEALSAGIDKALEIIKKK